jgi:hypothetical protein
MFFAVIMMRVIVSYYHEAVDQFGCLAIFQSMVNGEEVILPVIISHILNPIESKLITFASLIYLRYRSVKVPRR